MGIPNIWKWISTLPQLNEWKTSLISKELCTSKDDDTRKFLLVAEKVLVGDCSAWSVTFSFVLGGEWPAECSQKTLWVSNPCPFGTEGSIQKKTLPLILHLLEETLRCNAPLGNEMNMFADKFLCMDIESCGELCNFAFLCRLFWLCACEAPFEVGSLYFDMVDCFSPNINAPKKALESFFVSVGGECEENFMLSLGYMYTKFMCLRAWDERERFDPLTYSCSASGYCKIRACAPVLAMPNFENRQKFRLPNTDDPVLRYLLSHQQLDALIQLKYSITLHETCIEVCISVDNVRCNVIPLALGKANGVSEEKYFPSKISLNIAPEEGSQVLMISLNKSSDKSVRQSASHKILTGDCYSKFPVYVKSVSAIAACSNTECISSWKFEQSGEGNKGILQWVLYDNLSGKEVASSRPGKSLVMDSKAWFRDRYRKATRPFTSQGGVVFASDEYGQSVVWRLKRAAVEGKRLKWNVRGCFWITYWPNVYETSYCETRYVEICEKMDLILGSD